MRKLALLDWIHQLCEADRTIAYRIYALVDNIRLYNVIPFPLALLCAGIPFFLPFPQVIHFPAGISLTHLFVQSVLACLFYLLGAFLISRLIFRPRLHACKQELQNMFHEPNASRVLSWLIPLDSDLEEHTHSLLKPEHFSHKHRTHHSNG